MKEMKCGVEGHKVFMKIERRRIGVSASIVILEEIPMILT